MYIIFDLIQFVSLIYYSYLDVLILSVILSTETIVPTFFFLSHFDVIDILDIILLQLWLYDLYIIS